MSKPVLISHDGRILNDEKTPISPVVEKHQENDPLHIIAAREAAKQSTQVKETK